MTFFPLLNKSAHRINLEQIIRSNAAKVSGKILDIGSKDRRYDSWFRGYITACDIVADKPQKIEAADIHNLPYSDYQFDSIICFEVIEYTLDPLKAFAEMLRVLRPGGVLLVSTPFLNYFHDDRIRVTEGWLNENLSNLPINYKIKYIGNAYAIIVDIIRRKLVKSQSILGRYFGYPWLFFLGLFLPLSNKLRRDTRLVSGYFIIGVKK